MAKDKAHRLTLLGRVITPELVRDICQKAADARWGTHLLRWRYFEVHHGGVAYQRNALIPSGLWHLLKRVHVDQDWPLVASQEDLDRDIQTTVLDPETEIYVYGYYRTEPPRLQWAS